VANTGKVAGWSVFLGVFGVGRLFQGTSLPLGSVTHQNQFIMSALSKKSKLMKRNSDAISKQNPLLSTLSGFVEFSSGLRIGDALRAELMATVDFANSYKHKEDSDYQKTMAQYQTQIIKDAFKERDVRSLKKSVLNDDARMADLLIDTVANVRTLLQSFAHRVRVRLISDLYCSLQVPALFIIAH
jgi:hypothetical protein